VRVWDVSPSILCRQHLLGEHRELHAIWSVLVQGKKGYAKHPETLRWRGKLRALFARHEALVEEMTRRGFSHRSPLAESEATGEEVQDAFLNPVEEQLKILKNKPCDCPMSK
jgi:hypothetical protein